MFPGNSGFAYLIFTAVMAIFVKDFSICHFSLTVRAMKVNFPEVAAKVTKLIKVL